MVTPTNQVIARAGFTLRGASGTLGIFCNIFLPNIDKDHKKVLPSERRAPGTAPYGKSGPGYCITFIKRLYEGLK